ncbi:MAG: hypothetical protein ACWGQW_19850, partial [bacterium]
TNETTKRLIVQSPLFVRLISAPSCPVLPYRLIRYRLPFHATLLMLEVDGSIVGQGSRRGNGNQKVT